MPLCYKIENRVTNRGHFDRIMTIKKANMRYITSGAHLIYVLLTVHRRKLTCMIEE
jgi:hypothetical protein